MTVKQKYHVVMGCIVSAILILTLSIQLINANHKIRKLEDSKRKFLILSKSLANDFYCSKLFLDSPLTNEELSEISRFEMPG